MTQFPQNGRKRIIVGTRGSQLARTQTDWVVRELQKHLAIPIEIEVIKTRGDRIKNLSLTKIEGKGFFTKELEEALYDCRIDMAVHSLKDLPTDIASGLVIAAIPVREDPGELLLIHPDFFDPGQELGLQSNAIVGTGSLRRKTQLHALRGDLRFKDLRGNVPTRIRKLKELQYHAVVVAAAGYYRLGLKPDGYMIMQLLMDEILPAPGQGALAIQVRQDDAELIEWVQTINHAETGQKVSCERTLLKLLEGGCHLPLGTIARYDNGQISLQAVIGDPDWEEGTVSPLFKVEVSGMEPEETALKAFEELKKHMGKKYDQLHRTDKQRIIFTRSPEGNLELMDRLQLVQKEFVDYPLLQFTPCADSNDLQRILESITSYDWILFTSKTAVRFFEEALSPYLIPHRVGMGSIGPGTAETLEKAGYRVNYISLINTSEGLLDEFVTRFSSRLKKILIPGPERGQDKLYDGLKKRGANVEKLVLYRTEIRPADELPELQVRENDMIFFLSPSAVRGFLSYNQLREGNVIFSMGPATTEALRGASVPGTIIEPEESNLDSLVLTIKEFIIKQNK